MSGTTAIAWTERVWNPVVGCTKVSPGCAHCYASTIHTQRHEAFKRGKLQNHKQYAEPFSTVQLMHDRITQPLKWRQPSLIFVNSVADFFHDDVPVFFTASLFAVMKQTPRHTYQILTKRPENITKHLPADWGAGYQNVWLGVSVENQRHAYRAHILCTINAAKRFVSAEPLLGPVCLYEPDPSLDHYSPIELLDWIIAGGESGAQCRTMELDWARMLRDDCETHGVAYFLKQLGGHPNARAKELAILDGHTHTDMPAR